MQYKCHFRLIFPPNYSQVATSLNKVRVNLTVQGKMKSQILIWMSKCHIQSQVCSHQWPHSYKQMAFSQLLGRIKKIGTQRAVQDGGT